MVIAAATSTLAAYCLFHRLDVVRGYTDVRADQVSEAYAWILGVMTLIGCFSRSMMAATFGFIAGSMLFLGALSLMVLIWPTNPAKAFILMLPVAVGGAIVGWKKSHAKTSPGPL